MSAACPVCSGTTAPLLRLEAFPGVQNRFYDDEAAALGARAEALCLVACGVCGFVFDPRPAEARDWSEYDNAQSASPTYRNFLDQVAERVASVAALEPGKVVVEPGCGDGGLLTRLADRTGATVVGFDPAASGRADVPDFVRGESFHTDGLGPADVVVLRHVLEAVHDVDDLLRDAAASLCPGGVVYVEVTNVSEALARGAVELFSPEYRRYFSPAAITLLVERHGLRVRSLSPLFGGDYLEVVATRAARSDDLHAGIAAVGEAIRSARCALLWGAAGRAVGAISAGGWTREELAGVVDSDGRKQGRYLPLSGHRVLSPTEARALDPDLVVVANPRYLEEIRPELPAGTTLMTLDGTTHG